MIYRMSRSLQGPWITPSDDAFDGSAYYAGRTFELDGRRILFGWVPTKENNDDRSNYEWGGDFVPHEIFQRSDGTLGARVPETVWKIFKTRRQIQDCTIRADNGAERSTVILANDCSGMYSFEADLIFSEGTRSFSVDLRYDSEGDESYRFDFSVKSNRYSFDRTPNWPWFNYQNIGLERPLVLTPGETYHVRVIVDDDIATMYVNGVALNARMYSKLGTSVAVSVIGGSVHVRNASISREEDCVFTAE